VITKAEAEALREYFEDEAALYDQFARLLKSPLARKTAGEIRDHCYLRAREYDRLARSWLRRLFATAPR